MLSRFIGHEAIDEGPSGGRGNDAAEGCVEEVGIFADGFLEAGDPVVSENVEVDAVTVLLAKFVEGSKLRNLRKVVVAAVKVVSDQDRAFDMKRAYYW